jgi:hypothetical protein
MELTEHLFKMAEAQNKAREKEIIHNTAAEIRAVMARPNPKPVSGHDREWTPDQLADATGRHRYWIDRAAAEAVERGDIVRWIGPGGTGHTFISK